jgi:hypothetical protein
MPASSAGSAGELSQIGARSPVNLNLMVLWEEYRAVHPGGYGYSRLCDLFRGFERRLSPTMRQDHPAGDKVFVDYSGKKIMIVDRATGVVNGVSCAAVGQSASRLVSPRKFDPGQSVSGQVRGSLRVHWSRNFASPNAPTCDCRPLFGLQAGYPS